MENKNLRANKSAFTTILYPVLFGVVVFILWQTQVLHTIIGTDTFTLPLPDRVVGIIADNGPSITTNVIATLIVTLAGLGLGSLIGYLLGVVATVFPRWGGGGLSIVAAFNAVPIIAIAPIINNLTKDFSTDPNIRSMFAKIIVVTLVCMIAMSLSSYRGFTELKPFSEDLMKSYAASKRTIFFKLRVPNCVPYVFVALRVSVPAAVISALISEYFAEYVIGVGRQIRENIVQSQYATAWAYILVACAIGIIMYVALLILESIMLKGRR